MLLSLFAFAALAAAPVADHHQHLFSPADTTLVNEQAVLGTPLSAGMKRLFDARAARWNDEPGLARLLAADATVFDNENHAWVVGSAPAAKFLASAYPAPFRLEPSAVVVQGAIARATGLVVVQRGAETRPVGYFHWSLRQTAPDDWRIETEQFFFPARPVQKPITAADLIDMLDAAGIRRAAVLSEAFWWDGPGKDPAEAYPHVREENDWTIAQAGGFADRLLAFCSLNPLNSYAVAELERCAATGKVAGLKLSFEGSGVDLSKPDHVAKLRVLFAAANRLRMPIVVHVHGAAPYGRAEADVMLHQVVAAAPDVAVQIAHLWGGNGYAGEALKLYAEAFQRRDPVTRNLWFDIAEVAFVAGDSQDVMKEVARRLREIGIGRILYGSDAALNGRLKPAESWALTRKKLPLTEAEFATIAGNLAPYFKR